MQSKLPLVLLDVILFIKDGFLPIRQCREFCLLLHIRHATVSLVKYLFHLHSHQN